MKTYNNYQLYRTNPGLSGQVKWNLIIDNDSNGDIHVTDFQLVPINNNSLNIRPLKTNLLKHSHIENLKQYYNYNSKYFYDDTNCLDSQFKHNNVSINDGNFCPITYNMGCKRTSYKRNGKQFEFLCPLWIEKITKDIKFEFQIYSKSKNNSNFLLSKKVLTFNVFPDSENKFDTSFQTRFSRYLSNYIDKCNMKIGNSNVASIEFKELINNLKGATYLTLQGINLRNKIILNKNISKSKPILLSEFNEVSTLLETDKAIMSAFKNNAFICPQLLNFNFCFNIEDIMTYNIIKLLTDNNGKLYISVNVKVDDVELEKRDFDIEYDYIEKKLIYDNNSKTITDYINSKKESNINAYNVFGNEPTGKSTLYDSTCHWTLSNNDYIINSFQGFEGITIEESKQNDNSKVLEYYNDYQYADTPSITTIGDPELGDCSTRWINTMYISSWPDFNTDFIETDEYKNFATYIDAVDNEGEIFVNGIKIRQLQDTFENKYIIGIIAPSDLISRIYNNFDSKIIHSDTYSDSKVVICKLNENTILILSTNIKFLTINRIKSYINNCKDINEGSIFNKFSKFLEYVVSPKCVLFNDIESQCFRYDGNIKPRFVDTGSTLYYKDLVDNEHIGKLKSWTYNSVPIIDNDIPVINTSLEYSWFNENEFLILKPKIEFTTTIDINSCNDDGTKKYKDIINIIEDDNNYTEYGFNINSIVNEEIKNRLALIYGIDTSLENYNVVITYILNLYSKKIFWKLVEGNGYDLYKFDITLELK